MSTFLAGEEALPLFAVLFVVANAVVLVAGLVYSLERGVWLPVVA